MVCYCTDLVPFHDYLATTAKHTLGWIVFDNSLTDPHMKGHITLLFIAKLSSVTSSYQTESGDRVWLEWYSYRVRTHPATASSLRHIICHHLKFLFLFRFAYPSVPSVASKFSNKKEKKNLQRWAPIRVNLNQCMLSVSGILQSHACLCCGVFGALVYAGFYGVSSFLRTFLFYTVQ